MLTQILQRIEKQENNNIIIIERLTKLEQKLEATNKQQITQLKSSFKSITNTMVSNLRIATWNINGLLVRDELKLFLEEQNIDLCLISESHFTKQNYLKLKEYKLYLAIHPDNKARGDSAVIIKDNIKHCEEIKYETKSILSVKR